MTDSKTFNFRPISFFTSKNIPVSFIIYTKDHFQNTTNILQNIFNLKNPYEIIIVDNKSSNKQYFEDLVSNFKFIKLVKNNFSLSESINESISVCENNWIFYIDSTFTPNNSMWTNGVIECMMNLKSNNVKVVSPIIKSFKLFNNYINIKKDLILTDHFLPFYVLFFHKDLFRTIGHLTPEDDLAKVSQIFYEKMQKRGFKQAITPSSYFI